MRYRRLIPLLVFFSIVIVGGLALVVTSWSNPPQSPLIGKKIGFFSIPAFADPSDTLTPDAWKNSVTVINFFASWCEPCTAEHPMLMKLSQMQNVRIVGIAWKDKRENLSRWLGARGNPYSAIGIDGEGRTTLLFGLTGVPETFIVGKDGIIAYHHRSVISEAELANVIVPLIDRLTRL